MAAELTTQAESGTLMDAGAQRLLDNPMVRQLGVMIGIALSVALGVAVVLWSQAPSFSLLYGTLSQKDAPEVLGALQQANIEYRVEETTGAVMVASGSLHEARMKLAALGLPRGDSLGFELLQQDNGFGTSRTVEAARFQRALEGELARSVAAMTPVETARVHLATPKQSVFVRHQKHPSASVVLKLRGGRVLDKGQVDAIVHLVAASVPELSPERVTVVDHKGNLLSGVDKSQGIGLSSAQFEYTRELERHYKQRIQDLLAPVLGQDAVRAEVTAELDFTVTEQTQERFNPDQPALRSEQVQEQASKLKPVEGVPGALSNQPPAAGTAPEQAAGQDGETKPEPINTSTRATRNFELDKTISHTKLASGTLRRLSVAVVVDDRVALDEAGAAARTPRSQEEITRIETLVREAIGYSAQRGDSVQVVNAAFRDPIPLEPLPEPAVWEEPWFWDLMRQIGGVLLVLLLVFGVLRPTLKRLTAPTVVAGEGAAEGAGAAVGGSAGGGAGGAGGRRGGVPGEEGLEGELADDEAIAALSAEERVRLPGPGSYESTLEAARQLVRDDPKRVAQVVRRWIAEDA